MLFAGSYVVEGWLACDGASYPITNFQDLFDLIGFSYGGNGTSTFAVPDLRGKSPLGSDGGYQICTSGVDLRSSEGTMGELRLLAYPPSAEASYWLPCDGQFQPVNSRQALFSLLGTSYGGDGIHNFQLPNLVTKVPLPQCSYVIPIAGFYPDLNGSRGSARDYLGSIRIFCGATGESRLLSNHLPCAGGTLPLSQNLPLFSVFGTAYGGDGIRTFNLPNLAGLSPAEVPAGSQLSFGVYLICYSGFYPGRS